MYPVKKLTPANEVATKSPLRGPTNSAGPKLTKPSLTKRPKRDKPAGYHPFA